MGGELHGAGFVKTADPQSETAEAARCEYYQRLTLDDEKDRVGLAAKGGLDTVGVWGR